MRREEQPESGNFNGQSGTFTRQLEEARASGIMHPVVLLLSEDSSHARAVAAALGGATKQEEPGRILVTDPVSAALALRQHAAVAGTLAALYIEHPGLGGVADYCVVEMLPDVLALQVWLGGNPAASLWLDYDDVRRVGQDLAGRIDDTAAFTRFVPAVIIDISRAPEQQAGN